MGQGGRMVTSPFSLLSSKRPRSFQVMPSYGPGELLKPSHQTLGRTGSFREPGAAARGSLVDGGCWLSVVLSPHCFGYTTRWQVLAGRGHNGGRASHAESTQALWLKNGLGTQVGFESHLQYFLNVLS